MNHREKRVLRNKEALLLKNLEPNDIIHYLLQSRAIDDTVYELITTERTRAGRNKILLFSIKKTENGLKHLINAMKEDSKFLVDPLEEELNRLKEEGMPTDLRDILDHRKINTTLTEPQCLSLGKYITSNVLDEIGICLGFGHNDIELMKIDDQHNPRMLGFHLLIKWKQKEPSNANLSKLLETFDISGIDVDDDIINEFKE